jgi:hypothetical protein
MVKANHQFMSIRWVIIVAASRRPDINIMQGQDGGSLQLACISTIDAEPTL